MKVYRFIAGLVLLGFLPQATYAQAVVTKPISELPKPTLVQENRVTLLERGCVEVIGDAATQTVAQPADKPVHLYPNDWTAGKYVFCPENVKDTVTVKEGKVLVFGALIVGGIILGAAAAWIFDVEGHISDTVISIFTYVVSYLLQVAAGIGIAVVDFVSRGAEYLLTVGDFTKNPLVTRAWPLVQGLVNIGFLIALIYIAILVVLRLGEGWGKLLPRLIIAALLLNFSLVFGGILIDASRVIMAAELKLLWGPITPDDVPFGLQILKRSAVFNDVFESNFTRRGQTGITEKVAHTDHTQSTLLGKAMAVFLIWVLVFGLLYMVVGLVVRYVALVLLLAVSPVAYLGIAMPNLGGVTKQWWSLFWKYLIYGPIALFFLVMLAVLPRNSIGSDTISDLLMMAVTAGLLYAAIQVPKRLGGFGAGLVTGAAQKVAGFVKKRPALAAGAALGVFTGGASLLAAGAGVAGGALGAHGAKRYVGRPIRDFVKESTRPLRKKLGLGEYSKYDPKTGELRKGETSAGQKAGIRLADPKARAVEKAVSGVSGAKDASKLITPQIDSSGAPIMEDVPDIDPSTGEQKKVMQPIIDPSTGREVRDSSNALIMQMVPATKKVTRMGLHKELNTANLSNPRAMALLEGKQLEGIYEAAHKTGNVGVQRLLTQDKVAMRKMSDGYKAKMVAGDYDTKDEKFSEKAERTMRDIGREDAAK